MSLAKTVVTHAIVRTMEHANQLTACVTAVSVILGGKRLVVVKVGYIVCYYLWLFQHFVFSASILIDIFQCLVLIVFDDLDRMLTGFRMFYYTECASGSFGQNCSETCHCANDVGCHHGNGSCPLGSCASGWKGESCNQRGIMIVAQHT